MTNAQTPTMAVISSFKGVYNIQEAANYDTTCIAPTVGETAASDCQMSRDGSYDICYTGPVIPNAIFARSYWGNDIQMPAISIAYTNTSGSNYVTVWNNTYVFYPGYNMNSNSWSYRDFPVFNRVPASCWRISWLNVARGYWFISGQNFRAYYCPEGYLVSSSTVCTPCPVGTYNNGTLGPWCYPCPYGTLSPAQSTSAAACVLACPTGTYSATGLPPCTNCPNKTYNPSPGATACLACSQCAAGSFFNTSCFNASKGVCQACIPGNYCPVNGTAPSFPCPLGTYCPNASMTSPALCPAGAYCPSSNLNASTPCPSGTFSNATGMSLCYACPQGSFASATGLSACAPCPAGTMGANAGLSACALCAVGTYLTSIGSVATNCTACPVGQWCAGPPYATDPQPCTPLANGVFTSYGAGPDSCPYQCLDGYRGALCASSCPANHFCHNGTTTPCPEGTVTLAVPASSYLDCVCAPGTYGNVSGPTTASCAPCPANSFCPASIDASSCGCGP